MQHLLSRKITMSTELNFDNFIIDLQHLHNTCRDFHNKWDGVTETMEVTAEQQAVLKSIWDQQEAWYQEKTATENN